MQQGGALSPEKSYWVLIDYKWKHDEWSYKTVAEQPGILYMMDDNRQLHPLERISVSEGRRGLGVRSAADGNMTAQYNHMKEAAQNWADGL